MNHPAGERIFVGLGANLGDTHSTLAAAFEALDRLPGTHCVARSSLYRSAPVEATGPDYLNAIAELRSTLDPFALLTALQGIEAHFGRERSVLNAPRTLDLDLLLYGERQIANPVLTLPHPRWRERAFVIAPLAELAPDLVPTSALPIVAGQRIERIA